MMRIVGNENIARFDLSGMPPESAAALTGQVSSAKEGAMEGVVISAKKAGGTITTTFKKAEYMNKKGEPGKRRTRRTESAKKRAARNGA